jgi:hypothetical protein
MAKKTLAMEIAFGETRLLTRNWASALAHPVWRDFSGLLAPELCVM